MSGKQVALLIGGVSLVSVVGVATAFKVVDLNKSKKEYNSGVEHLITMDNVNRDIVDEDEYGTEESTELTETEDFYEKASIADDGTYVISEDDYKKVDKDEVPVGTVIELDDGSTSVVTGEDSLTAAGNSVSEDWYFSETNKSVVEGSIEDCCGLHEVIDIQRFSNVCAEVLGVGIKKIEAYGGGRYGLFNVKIVTEDDATYDCVWDDSKGYFYASHDIYEGIYE